MDFRSHIKVGAALADGKEYLQAAGWRGGEALKEARALLSHATRRPATELLAFDEAEVSPGEMADYRQGLHKRRSGEPMASIRGVQEFYGLEFACHGNLIPRPDSEAVVELALASMPTRAERLLDLGCGSGCLGIATAVHSGVHVTLCDSDSRALQNAAINAERHLQAGDWKVTASNWFSAISEKYDIIISNPPYVGEDDLPYLPRGVRCYEPVRALWGGVSGLQAYEILAETAAGHLNDGGVMVVEAGNGQAEAVTKIFTSGGWRPVGDRRDLQNIRRALSFRRGAA